MPGCAEDHTREGPLHYNTAMEGADEAVFVRVNATASRQQSIQVKCGAPQATR